MHQRCVTWLHPHESVAHIAFPGSCQCIHWAFDNYVAKVVWRICIRENFYKRFVPWPFGTLIPQERFPRSVARLPVDMPCLMRDSGNHDTWEMVAGIFTDIPSVLIRKSCIEISVLQIILKLFYCIGPRTPTW